MRRYLTRWYVSTAEREARRHAEIDHTPWEEVEITEDVELLHVIRDTSSWAYWSDGRFTTGIGLEKQTRETSPQVLSRDAEKLISAVRGSDGPGVFLEDGLRKLAEVDRILQERTVETGPRRGHYARQKIEAMNIRLRDRTEHTWYTFSEGYIEGYLYGIWPDLESLWDWLRKMEETYLELEEEGLA